MQGMAMDVSRSAAVCRAPSLLAAPPIVAPAGMHSFVYLEDPRTKTLCGSLSDSLKLVRRQRDSIMHISCSALNDSRAGDDDIGATSSSKNAENGAAVANTSPMSKAGRASESSGVISSKGGGNANASSTVVGANSNRAGLFRTPISGGVQSATSSHGLPDPAIAVRNLIEQARYAHLCTIMSRMHHRRRGYPFGSLVDFATDASGHPIFSLSPLAIHTRNLLADPRCTLVVQIPGWSGLANARVTIFGDVYPLPEDQQDLAHKYYIAKHQQGASHQWGNFTFFRMENISDIYFVGGFGTVAWVDVKEYEKAHPDTIAANGAEQTLKVLNTQFSRPLKELLSVEVEVDDAALISIDSKGVDIRVRQGAQFNVQRVSFEEGHAVETLEQANKALQHVLDKAATRTPGPN